MFKQPKFKIKETVFTQTLFSVSSEICPTFDKRVMGKEC